MDTQMLVKGIKEQTGLPGTTVSRGLDGLKETILRALSEGGSVNIPHLGTFSTLRQEALIVPNPEKPDQPLNVPPMIIPRFHVSSDVKEKLKMVIPRTTSKEDLAYSHSVSIPYLDLSQRIIPKEILNYIPEHIARRHQIVPVEEKDGKLTVSMIDPEDQETIEFIKKRTGMPIDVTICTLDDLNHILDQYSALQTEVAEIVKSAGETPLEKVEEEKQEATADETSEHSPASKIVDSLFKRAIREKASDIHIEPMEDEIIVRFRIDGILRKIVSLPKNIHPAIISRIKILTNLKIDETRRPQDGRFQIRTHQIQVDFRVSTLPTVNGEKIVARILDKSAGIISLEELGMRNYCFDVLEENITKSHGMILVTGPTGSGKTTTLYAILDRLRDVSVNIVTLEDPVEYRIPTINQCQVNTDIGYTFANGLRSILRQDPNIIMVGEIRDFDTANIAVHSALTGHVVLSTLHTNSAAGAIPRLMDMKIEPFLLTSSLNCVAAQRLCRKICEDCREELKMDEGELSPIIDELKALPEAIRNAINLSKLVFYHGKGCGACGNTGFRGRIGIYEILALSPEVNKLIVQKASDDAFQQAAEKLGMVTMKQDGIIKALEGKTTLAEVWRVTKD